MKCKGLMALLIGMIVLTGCGAETASKPDNEYNKTEVSDAAESKAIHYFFEQVEIEEQPPVFSDEDPDVMDTLYCGDRIYSLSYCFEVSPDGQEFSLIGDAIQMYRDGEWETVYSCEMGEDFSVILSLAGISDDGLYVVNYGDEDIPYVLSRLDEEGNLETIGNLAAIPVEASSWSFRLDGDKLYTIGDLGDRVVEFSDDYQEATPVEMPCRVAALQGPSNNLYWYGISEGNLLLWDDLRSAPIMTLEGSYSEYGNYAVTYSEEGDLYLADRLGITRKSADGSITQIPFSENDLIVDSVTAIFTEDGEAIRLYTECEKEACVLLGQPTDNDPNERPEIRIAGIGWNPAFEDFVSKYNRMNGTVRFVVEDFADYSDWGEYATAVQLELSSGGGPDLISDYMFDPYSWAELGYVLPLDEIIEECASDGDGFFDAAFGRGRIQDVQYGIPYEYQAHLFVASGQMTGRRDSWSLADCMELVRDSSASAVGAELGAEDLVLWFGVYDPSRRDLIDRENGVCHLDSGEFIDLLEFSRDYGWDKTNDSAGDVRKAVEMAKAGEALGAFPPYVCDLESICQYDVLFDGDANLIGFPGEEQSGAYLLSSNLYVNANTEYAEEIKAFLKYLLSAEGQEKRSKYAYPYGAYLPVRKDVLKEIFDWYRKDAEQEGDSLHNDGITSYRISPLTEEQQVMVKNLLENARPFDSENYQFAGIIEEEMGTFLAGERSAEETAAIIQSRIGLYLKETR